MTTLDEYLDDSVNISEDLQVDLSLFVTNDLEASRIMRKLSSLAKQMEANVSIADAERTRIDEWEQEVNIPLAAQASYLDSLLTQWAIYQRDQTGQKSFSFPHGKISTTVLNNRVVVNDEEAFIAWAETQPNADTLVRIKKAAKMDGVKELAATGEVIPGIAISEPEYPYSVRVKPNA